MSFNIIKKYKDFYSFTFFFFFFFFFFYFFIIIIIIIFFIYLFFFFFFFAGKYLFSFHEIFVEKIPIQKCFLIRTFFFLFVNRFF